MGDVGGGSTTASSENEAKFIWHNRSAKDWSKSKFRERFLNHRFETTAGACKITDLLSCEGDAYATRTQGYMAVYDWNITLRWKGKPKEYIGGDLINGTIDISCFTSRGSLSDLQIQVDITNPDAKEELERLRTAFRSVVVPRLRGEVENYIFLLLDVLKAPTRGSATASRPPPKPHVWLKTSQADLGDGDELPNSQSGGQVDVFQDREGGGGMRVGRDFQAKIPSLLGEEDRRSPQENNEKALLVWAPSDLLSEEAIEKYLETSREKYQYSGEQSLGLLYWHRYDVQRALQDLGNFTPHPEEWTVEDKVLFEQAFQFHGKAFDRIRQMLPDKSMSNLIRYYYKWKKFKNKTSVMDRQAKKFSQEDEDGLAPFGSNNNNRRTGVVSSQQCRATDQGPGLSDMESDEKIGDSAVKRCTNCRIACTEINAPRNLCNTCHIYWKKTSNDRPLPLAQPRGHKHGVKVRFPPKRVYINHDDLVKLANATPQAENIIQLDLEKEVHCERYKIQLKKQRLELAKREFLTKDEIKDFMTGV